MLDKRGGLRRHPEPEPVCYAHDSLLLVNGKAAPEQAKSKWRDGVDVSHVNLTSLHYLVVHAVPTVKLLVPEGEAARVHVHVALERLERIISDSFPAEVPRRDDYIGEKASG